MTRIGAVVIGRNEGDRLAVSLASLEGCVDRIVYVDSGSTDGSVTVARQAGAEVVALDMSAPFTAARARNAGFAALEGGADFVQFIDGDCSLRADWLSHAVPALEMERDLALVCGRRREKHPEASPYNALCDLEWNTPVGDASACGGDFLIRAEAFAGVDGFDAALVAGEEPDLCLRLRRKGWRVRRLEAEMTWHDADMHRFGQWWRRSMRAGYAFAEGAARHGGGPERHWIRETWRAVGWGIGLPILVLGLSSVAPLALLLLALYPLQAMRLAWRGRPAVWAVFTVLGKFPEAQGVIGYWWERLMRRQGGLIEYK